MGGYVEFICAINRMRAAHSSIELHTTIYFALRREGRNAPAALYARVPFCLRKSHARPRVQQAPGLPCALRFEEGKRRYKSRATSAARTRNYIHRHCERSEAIHCHL